METLEDYFSDAFFSDKMHNNANLVDARNLVSQICESVKCVKI